MQNRMKTIMLLCDHAEAVNRKLYVMGGGFSVCAPGVRSMFIALKVIVPWDEANVKHRLAIILQDENGNTIELGKPPRPVRQEGDFEVGRPPGLPMGMDLDFILAMGFSGITLEPDRRYRWQLEIDDEPADHTSFRTTPAKR